MQNFKSLCDHAYTWYTGYGGIYKRKKEETRWEGVREPSTHTMHTERVGCALRQMDHRRGLQAQSCF